MRSPPVEMADGAPTLVNFPIYLPGTLYLDSHLGRRCEPHPSFPQNRVAQELSYYDTNLAVGEVSVPQSRRIVTT